MDCKTRAILDWIPKNYHFEWCMQNFSYNFFLPFRTYVSSPEFHVELDGDITKWHLIFYPCGCEEENYVSAHLSLDYARRRDLLVSCEFTLTNTRGYTIACVSFGPEDGTFNEGQAMGFNRIVLRENIAREISYNDVLIFHCDIEVNYRVQNLSRSCISNRHSSLANDFAELRRNGDYSDITISINGVEFHAHKNILSARSPVFSAMFKHQMKEANSGNVHINDIEPEVFEEFLNYIYSGNAKFDVYAIKLLAAADKYDLMDLKARCVEVLIKTLSKENCFKFLHLGDIYSADKLKEHAVKFIASDITDRDLQRLAELNDSSILLDIIQELVKK